MQTEAENRSLKQQMHASERTNNDKQIKMFDDLNKKIQALQSDMDFKDHQAKSEAAEKTTYKMQLEDERKNKAKVSANI